MNNDVTSLRREMHLYGNLSVYTIRKPALYHQHKYRVRVVAIGESALPRETRCHEKYRRRTATDITGWTHYYRRNKMHSGALQITCTFNCAGNPERKKNSVIPYIWRLATTAMAPPKTIMRCRDEQRHKSRVRVDETRSKYSHASTCDDGGCTCGCWMETSRRPDSFALRSATTDRCAGALKSLRGKHSREQLAKVCIA